MIVRPAIDLREGQCVQLVGGDYNNELIRLPDPVAIAQEWIDKGFTSLHVVDLDRATGRGSNIDLVTEIAALSISGGGVDIRVGGGIRSTDDVVEILGVGSSSAVVGTQAIAEPEWFEEITNEYPEQLFVALEVDGRDVKVKGWQESSEHSLEDLLIRFSELEIAGIFVTAIHKEGRREGTDFELFRELTDSTMKPIIASGGITTLDEITALHQVGVAEVVLGAAIYTNPDLVTELQEEHNSGRQPLGLMNNVKDI